MTTASTRRASKLVTTSVNRLAEMQLRILWEELLTRFETIEVVSPPEGVQSNFVKGYERLMVQVSPAT
ncbi:MULTISPECIES: hypothetical protein [unclassified Ruegeria]|uniref:hypothetical protein n=1 Tax=unclassified Ruegeria TaxID=2625375 RepID=UPI001C2C9124|nr:MULTISPECIES: hypothetical protein [unclassified Ruegeria]